MKNLSIDLRDPRLRGGRMAINAQTMDPAERDARAASLVQLLGTEKGRAIIERLRARKLRLEDVHKAVQSLDLSAVEPKAEDAAKEAPPIMLGATIDGWLRYIAGADRADATLELYTGIARSLETHFGVKREAGGRIVEDVPVGLITRKQGEEWLTGKKSTGASWAPRTQTVAHSLAAQIWDRALAEDEERIEKHGAEPSITRNFWRRQGSRKGVRAARIRKTRVEFLRREEAGRLLWKVRGKQYAAWVAVGIYAGLRAGESANLRRKIDVDTDAGVLRIQPRKGEHAWRTKTDNSVRNVPIHPRLARWIRRHEAIGYAGEVYLFRQPGQDRPLTRSGWRWWTKEAFEAAGIRYGRRKDALTAHSLRHTFASWLTMADVHPLKIAKLMGDTVEMVMRTYAHLVSEDLEQAVRRL